MKSEPSPDFGVFADFFNPRPAPTPSGKCVRKVLLFSRDPDRPQPECRAGVGVTRGKVLALLHQGFDTAPAISDEIPEVSFQAVKQILQALRREGLADSRVVAKNKPHVWWAKDHFPKPVGYQKP